MNTERDRKREPGTGISRRNFLKYSGAAGALLLVDIQGGLTMENAKNQVTLVSTPDRKSGVVASIQALRINPVRNKNVLIKPNFNTADRAPGSTHNDTLVALVEEIWQMGAKTVRLGERSYAPTRQVMQRKGIIPLLQNLDVEIIDFDDLNAEDWVKLNPPGSHWRDGFRVARPVLETECLISTGCLKTHQYGGVFTLSLKLHVGVVPTHRHGYDYMRELHGSRHQQRMIAEINAPFKPDLIVLDGVEAFVDGGPMDGKRAPGNVFLASTDRVAIDAVGVAILKFLGSNAQIMQTPIFEQQQIARAAEMGLGAASPSEIEVVAADDQSRAYRDEVVAILNRG
ncbi:MAG: DUF362 domain-containing protein [Desulfobacterales bacterium]|nr:MAG: DUF362 domain-containing protein [Desulfobacterales bacterium]